MDFYRVIRTTLVLTETYLLTKSSQTSILDTLFLSIFRSAFTSCHPSSVREQGSVPPVLRWLSVHQCSNWGPRVNGWLGCSQGPQSGGARGTRWAHYRHSLTRHRCSCFLPTPVCPWLQCWPSSCWLPARLWSSCDPWRPPPPWRRSTSCCALWSGQSQLQHKPWTNWCEDTAYSCIEVAVPLHVQSLG